MIGQSPGASFLYSLVASLGVLLLTSNNHTYSLGAQGVNLYNACRVGTREVNLNACRVGT